MRGQIFGYWEGKIGQKSINMCIQVPTSIERRGEDEEGRREDIWERNEEIRSEEERGRLGRREGIEKDRR